MILEVSEGSIYGEHYYTVEPIKWFMELESWCVHTFGCPPIDGVWKPHQRWYMNDRKFWFRDKKDLEWFVLKWA
jgi:hypothetical protein